MKKFIKAVRLAINKCADAFYNFLGITFIFLCGVSLFFLIVFAIIKTIKWMWGV